jgi:hypothetical protein
MLRLLKKQLVAVVKTLQQLMPKMPDTNSPQCCTKIEQLDFTNTLITLSLLEQCVYEHYLEQDGIDSGGDLSAALVNLKDFHEKVTKFSKAPIDVLNLKLSSEGLTLEGICVEDGRDVVNHTTACRLYGGAVSDFRVPEITWELCGTVETSKFNRFIGNLSRFGNFTSEDQGNGQIQSAPVRFSIENEIITGLCYNARVLRNAHIYTSTNCLQSNELVFNIPGHYLDYLTKLSTQAIQIYSGFYGQSNSLWIKFEGEVGALSCKAIDSSYAPLVMSKLFVSDTTENSRLNLVARRKIEPDALYGSFEIQALTSSLRQHLVTEEPPHLYVKDSQSIASKSSSRVRVQADGVLGTWEPLLIPYDFPSLITEAGKSKDEEWAVSKSVILEHRYYIRGKSTKEAHYIYVQSCSESSGNMLRYICPVTKAENNLDQLDSGD